MKFLDYNNDLCVKERMHRLIYNLIRTSKQRVDKEKTVHRTIVMSDIRQEILSINLKTREELQNNRDETEKSPKPTDPMSSVGARGQKKKGKTRVKLSTHWVEKSEKIKLMRPVARKITVKDVIAVLEREPQMSRSSLMYQLYNKFRKNDDAGK